MPASENQPRLNPGGSVVDPGFGAHSLKQTAFRSGADGFLIEPLEPESLAAIVRTALKSAQAHREAATLAERVRSLEGKVREAESETEQFAAQICHDIEEPLRALGMFVELVHERREGKLSREERTYLELVLSASNRVRHMLRGFLSYSQAGRGRRTRFSPVNLKIVAASAVQSLRQRIDETGAVVRLDQTFPSVPGDFGDLQQVFKQVIGNAIEYSRTGPPPSVTVSANRDGEEWTITISDNGPGIAAELQSAVFLPFKRLHGRDIPGAGLGLSISRKIVEAHGGRMWVEGEPGKGRASASPFLARAAEKPPKPRHLETARDELGCDSSVLTCLPTTVKNSLRLGGFGIKQQAPKPSIRSDSSGRIKDDKIALGTLAKCGFDAAAAKTSPPWPVGKL